MTGLILIAAAWGSVFGAVVRFTAGAERRRAARWATYRRLNHWGMTNERALWAWERAGKPRF